MAVKYKNCYKLEVNTYWWFIKNPRVKQVLWELSDSVVTLLDSVDYSILTGGGMKKCTGDTTSFQVCLIHVLILLSLACFITCETTMAPYSETLIRRNATNKVSCLLFGVSLLTTAFRRSTVLAVQSIIDLRVWGK